MLFWESIPFYICGVLFLKTSIWLAEFLNFLKTYTSFIPGKFLIDPTPSSHLLLTPNWISPYLTFFLYLYYNNSSPTALYLLMCLFLFSPGSSLKVRMMFSLLLYTSIMSSVHLFIEETFIEQLLHFSHSSQHFDSKVNTIKSHPLRTYVLLEINVW